jgi:hypothetical protein
MLTRLGILTLTTVLAPPWDERIASERPRRTRPLICGSPASGANAERAAVPLGVLACLLLPTGEPVGPAVLAEVGNLGSF